ncbi:MAG: CNNM domain-containing protein [Prosthecobacter sp.]
MLFPALLLYLALLALLAVISAAETAIHSVRDVEKQLQAAGEGSVARRLREISANPFAPLQQAQLLSAALNLSLAALGVWIVTGPLKAVGWSPWLASCLLFLSTVILGDMVPKFFAARSPAVVLLASLRLLRPLRRVLDPLTGFVDRTADALLSYLVPHHLKTRLPVTRDEFETLVEMRQEQGLLESEEGAMIHEALEIEGLTVRDCMVPRVDLAMMSAEDSETQTATLLERAAGRFVIVYGETPDSVLGIIDASEWKLSGRLPWRECLQTPAFVPETMPILDALNEHLRDQTTPLIIVDEYGGLEGMISRREIADWLLYDAAPWRGEAADIRDLGRGRFLLDGGARLDHLRDELSIDLEAEAGGIDTIGGLVFTHLGHVPKPGERFHLGGVDIKVRRVVRARIQEVELRLEPKGEE